MLNDSGCPRFAGEMSEGPRGRVVGLPECLSSLPRTYPARCARAPFAGRKGQLGVCRRNDAGRYADSETDGFKSRFHRATGEDGPMKCEVVSVQSVDSVLFLDAVRRSGKVRMEFAYDIIRCP